MSLALENIFALRIGSQVLMHAPLHGFSALVNPAAAAALSQGRHTGQMELDRLLEKEILPPPAPHEGELQPEFLGIIPTRACNLRCRYCGFGATRAAGETLDIATALQTVDWMAERLSLGHRSRFEVHFFGGEPFCASDVVDAVIHRVRWRASQLGLLPFFEADTNGFFDTRRCEFIADYIDSVVLSLDGPPGIQNRLRPAKDGSGSHARVADNARRLARSQTELCLRVCVTSETVNSLPEIIRGFSRSIRPDIIDFEPLKPCAESEAAGLHPPDPWQFARQFARAAEICAANGVLPVYAAAAIDTLRISFCPVGRDTLILSPDGRLSACYLLQEEWRAHSMDLNMGRTDRQTGPQIDQAAVERVRGYCQPTLRCQGCFARWHCAGGCHVHNTPPGSGADYDDFCIATRLIAAYNLLKELGRIDIWMALMEDAGKQQQLVFATSDRLDKMAW